MNISSIVTANISIEFYEVLGSKGLQKIVYESWLDNRAIDNKRQIPSKVDAKQRTANRKLEIDKLYTKTDGRLINMTKDQMF